VIDIQSIRKELPIKKVELINDLIANAYGICLLKKRNFEDLNAVKMKRFYLK